jgi:hypothetical protein
VEHIDRCVGLGGHFVGLGDYTDFASPSNRKRYKQADLYDNAQDAIELTARYLAREVYKKYLVGTYWLGLVHGHHYFEFVDGTNSDQYLASLLDTAYLGTSAIIRLHFEEGCKSGAILLWMHHGNGGGMKSYSPLTKLENLAMSWDVDIFLMGHQTKVATSKIDRVYPVFHGDSAKLYHKTVHLVGTGGWSKAYMIGNKRGNTPQGCYVEQKMLMPVALGAPIIYIDPEWKNGKWSPRIRVEV